MSRLREGSVSNVAICHFVPFCSTFHLDVGFCHSFTLNYFCSPPISGSLEKLMFPFLLISPADYADSEQDIRCPYSLYNRQKTNYNAHINIANCFSFSKSSSSCSRRCCKYFCLIISHESVSFCSSTKYGHPSPRNSRNARLEICFPFRCPR